MRAEKILRLIVIAQFAVMFILLGWRLLLFLQMSAHAVHSPYERDYGEGIVWQQANLMFTSQAYGPINGFPAIVFHYPPLYHVATRAVAALTSGDMLFAGRAVSLGATLWCCAMAGLIACRATPNEAGRWVRVSVWLAAALLPCNFYPIYLSALRMRVDMLAYAFALTGFWFGLRALERPVYIYGAALCFVAAVYTKQNTLAAAFGLFVPMLWMRPQLAFNGIVACVLIGLVPLIGLEWVTHGGFLRHIVLYNLNNRVDWSQYRLISGLFDKYWIIFIFATLPILYSIIKICINFRKIYPDNITLIYIISYFIFNTILSLDIFKSGANINYMVEWLLIVSICAALALVGSLNFMVSGVFGVGHAKVSQAILMLWPLLFVGSLLCQKPPNFVDYISSQRAVAYSQLSARIRTANKPIISDDMVILLENGKNVVWEPAIFAELASKGVWDERPFVAKIKGHDFAMFITEGVRGRKLFDARYTPAVAAAMDQAYPVLEPVAGYTLHLPAQVSIESK